MFKPLTPQIWLLILPSSFYFVKWLWEFGGQSKKYLVPDEFEYSHYLFAK